MSDENGKEMKIHFAHGTTTLAFKYNGGVIVCADSRATGGNYIGKWQGYHFQKRSPMPTNTEKEKNRSTSSLLIWTEVQID